MEEYIAHSAKGKFPPQTYADHISAVVKNAARFAAEAESYSHTLHGELEGIVRNAAALHDLGKLHAENQAVLHDVNGKNRLPINHVDAGCAELLRKYALFSALVVYSHHRGLPDISRELIRGEKMFRDNRSDMRDKVERALPEILSRHKLLCNAELIQCETQVKGDRPLFLRMALSCLADADHADTSAVYGNNYQQGDIPKLRAKERLEALDKYVSDLGGNDERSRLRQEMYNVCRNVVSDTSFCVCDAPVGSGKTTAVMANLLRQAIKNNSRRIFVVLPYTNIIRQSVRVYRKALTLPGEDPEEVVAELHFRANFQDKETRYLTSLWRSPIIITTAVAFFSTLASSRPSALRRLHELPGSVIFLDEAHCMLPLKLLPLAWHWMNVLADGWGCRWVLASGSLVRYWELGNLSNLELPRPDITELIGGELRRKLAKYEARRIFFCSRDRALSRRELITVVQESPGPRLLIVNTVQSAAVIAEDIRELYGRKQVEHLSTALMPKDRGTVIKRISDRLADTNDTNWTLVATSCVEAGVDFSFRTGFRELSSLLSLLQTAGRVNRHGEFDDSEIWSFSLQDDGMLTKNESLQYSVSVLSSYLKSGIAISPELCTKSLDDEMIAEGGVTLSNIQHFLQLESDMCFEELDKSFEPIESDTVSAVIDEALAEEIAHGGGDWHRLQMCSVSIPCSRIKEWALDELLPGVYRWTLGYDSFLGYMHGVINAKMLETGFLTV